MNISRILSTIPWNLHFFKRPSCPKMDDSRCAHGGSFSRIPHLAHGPHIYFLL